MAAKVDQRVESLLGSERTRWAATDERLSEAIDELARMARGGKRLRAAFCYYAWRGAGGNPADEAEAIDAGAAFELLQTFALIHDDIMDDADTRRGEATIHVHQAEQVVANGWTGEPRRYGEGIALLVGDLAHVYADQLIGSHSRAARDLWDELRIELNLGQYLDMRAAAAGQVDNVWPPSNQRCTPSSDRSSSAPPWVLELPTPSCSTASSTSECRSVKRFSCVTICWAFSATRSGSASRWETICGKANRPSSSPSPKNGPTPDSEKHSP